MAAVEVAAHELSSSKFCCSLSWISVARHAAGVFLRAVSVAVTYNPVLVKQYGIIHYVQ